MCEHDNLIWIARKSSFLLSSSRNGSLREMWKDKTSIRFHQNIFNYFFQFLGLYRNYFISPLLFLPSKFPIFPSLLWGTMLLVSLVVLHVLFLVMSAYQWVGEPKIQCKDLSRAHVAARLWAKSTHSFGSAIPPPRHKPVHWGHQSFLPFTMTPPLTSNSVVFHLLDILANWK